MVSVCTVPARGGRSCEHFGGYKTINRIPLPLHHPHLENTPLSLNVGGTNLQVAPRAKAPVIIVQMRCTDEVMRFSET